VVSPLRFVPARFKDGCGPVGAWFLLLVHDLPETASNSPLRVAVARSGCRGESIKVVCTSGQNIQRCRSVGVRLALIKM